MTRLNGLTKSQSYIEKARDAFFNLSDASNESEAYYMPYGLGGLAALEKHNDDALEYLKQALLLNKQGVLNWVQFDAAWQDLRNDETFQSLTL